MRTNATDATTFRCLVEYYNLVNICSKLFNKNYDNLIKEYLKELIAFDTLKQVRERHAERIKHINHRIDKYIEKHKNIKINIDDEDTSPLEIDVLPNN